MLIQAVIQTALWLLVVGLLIAGTRFALARPGNFAFGPPAGEREQKSIFAPVFTVLLAAFTAGAMFSFRMPSHGTPYFTIALIVVLAVILARDASPSPWRRAAVLAVSVAAAGSWLIAATWLTYTAAAAFLAFALIALVRVSVPFWQFALMQIVLAAWDYYGVIIARSTEVAAANLDPFLTTGPVARVTPGGQPVMIGLPAHLGMLSPYINAIGIGDVTLAGVLIVIAGRAGMRAGTPRLYWAGVCGYPVGLAAARITGDVTGWPQPALCFVIPAVIIAVAIAAWRTGTWAALAGKAPQPAAEPEPQAAAA